MYVINKNLLKYALLKAFKLFNDFNNTYKHVFFFFLLFVLAINKKNPNEWKEFANDDDDSFHCFDKL